MDADAVDIRLNTYTFASRDLCKYFASILRSGFRNAPSNFSVLLHIYASSELGQADFTQRICILEIIFATLHI